MFKELGIDSWGHRIKLKKAIAKLTLETITDKKDTLSEPTDDGIMVDEIVDANECELCKASTQHRCRKCSQLVCILYCSTPDPESTNEMHVVHKPGDTRCTGQGFECPTCGTIFETAEELQHHIENNHEQESAMSLISHNTEIELLLQEEESINMDGLHFNCSTCGNSYDSNDDLRQHIDVIHGHSESNTTLESLLVEDEDLSELQVGKRIPQNLKDIDFDNTSDEDDDYIPNDDDLETFVCTECEYECTEKKIFDKHMISHNTKSNPKRKKNDTANQISNKKQPRVTEFTCDQCDQKFTRKDNMNRHMKRKH